VSRRGEASEGLPGRPQPVGLRRSLTLFYAVLYGTGVTIGAGIYVLIGAAAARAGMQAPLAFVVAAMIMALTAASFAAGEAAYVRAASGSDRLSEAVGFLVIAIAVVAAAAISVGSAGYVALFVAVPQPVIIAAVVLGMGAIAAWGIKESVVFAGAMTLIEIGGLVVLIAAGAFSGPDVVPACPRWCPPASAPPGWRGSSVPPCWPCSPSSGSRPWSMSRKSCAIPSGHCPGRYSSLWR
jgi:amino acid transporter